MKIEVGMLVVLIDDGDYADWAKKWIGHVGRVLSPAVETPDAWIIDGIIPDPDQEVVVAKSCKLRPINPDSEPADEDFQKDLKRWLDKKVTA